MNWINFVRDHPGSLNFPRIGRSIYSYSGNFNDESTTIVNWFRETERALSN